MKNLLVGLSLLPMLGCGVGQYTATTEAQYNAETGSWSYKSNKNQENFEAKLVESKAGRQVLEVKTTATTPEAAIAAALQSNLEIQKQISGMLQALMPPGSEQLYDYSDTAFIGGLFYSLAGWVKEYGTDIIDKTRE